MPRKKKNNIGKRRLRSSRWRRRASSQRRVSFGRQVRNVHRAHVVEERALGAAYPLVRMDFPEGIPPDQRKRLCREFLHQYFRRPDQHAAWVETHRMQDAFDHFYSTFLTEIQRDMHRHAFT